MDNILSEKDTKVVIDILVKELDVEASQLSPEATLAGDLGADSLTIVQIIMSLEEHFDISIPDEESDKVSTVRDVFEVLADLLTSSEARPG